MVKIEDLFICSHVKGERQLRFEFDDNTRHMIIIRDGDEKEEIVEKLHGLAERIRNYKC